MLFAAGASGQAAASEPEAGGAAVGRDDEVALDLLRLVIAHLVARLLAASPEGVVGALVPIGLEPRASFIRRLRQGRELLQLHAAGLALLVLHVLVELLVGGLLLVLVLLLARLGFAASPPAALARGPQG